MQLKRVDVSIVYLTEDELKKLADFYKKGQYQENYHRTLRHFLFMCYTGVRISDLQRLKPENIQENTLKFVPYKTRAQKGKEIQIPLIDKAKKLIADEMANFERLLNVENKKPAD